MILQNLKVGESAVIKAVGGEGALRQHFLDMGLIPGVGIKKIGQAPLGDPMQFRLRGYNLSLRKDEAAMISVETAPADASDIVADEGVEDNFGYNLTLHEHNAHPGYGEGGKYHHHDDDARALPKDTVLTFALAGQQNSGKTTLFNALTGSSQHVGNFPGVTVDRKDGQIRGHALTEVVDLPGVYSLSPYTPEEMVTRRYILDEKPKAIINIVDASNIERNLYLTLQLMELGTPMVVALNMMDEVVGNGGSIRVNEMERILGLPVVPISAAKNDGVEELVSHALHVARYQETPVRQDFCDPSDGGGALHRCLHSIVHLIEDHSVATGIPARFAAEKIVEGDKEIVAALGLSEGDVAAIESIVAQMEKEGGLDRRAAVAQMRYDFIGKLCSWTVRRGGESREYTRSRRIDKVLTGRWTAIPIFLLVMVAIIYLSIDVLGAPLQELLQRGIDALGEVVDGLLVTSGVSEAMRSMVSDGIFGGVGAVVSFVPIIIILFFFLSLLEDSGYMARVAYVTDKLLRRLGLSGRSIVPLLIGFGCSVPAVMATRTLPSTSDRWKTILLTPFMSCSAKIPIYAFFTSAFFPGKGGLVLCCLYLLAIFVGVLVALVRKWTSRHKDASPFVMELPNYRLPRLGNVGHLLWDKTKDFLQRAFTIIFLATLIIWFLQSFDIRFNYVEDSSQSMLAAIAGWIAPVLSPLGLGDWRIVTSLISGFLAKESVVAMMELLGVGSILTLASAVSMMVFCLLYTPCVAAIAAVRRELGLGWALFMVLFQCAVAWLVALLAYNLALLVL